MSTNPDFDAENKLQCVMEAIPIILTEEQEVTSSVTAITTAKTPSNSLDPIKLVNIELSVKNVNICRVCLEEGNIPIYGNEKYGDVSEDLNSLANIKVTTDDSFPKYLCYSCYTLLESAIQLRKTAMHSEAQLLGLITMDPSMTIFTEQSNNIKLEQEPVSNKQSSNPESDSKLVKPTNTKPLHESKVQTPSNTQPLPSTSKLTPINKPTKPAAVEKTINNWSPSGGMIIKDLSLIRQEIMKTLPETFSTTSKLKDKKHKLDIMEIIKLHRLKSSLNVTKPKKPKQVDKSKRNKTPKFHCKRCNLTFETKEQCHEHKHSDEHKNCKVPCPVCGQLYGTGYMKIHMEFHNKDDVPKYVCDHCGKEFKSSIIFYQHRRSHTKTLSFKCSQCSYRHWDKHVLKRHMRIHSNAGKPFVCTQCPKSFSLKCNLNRHLLTHEGPKWNCDGCQKSFYSQSTLDQHYKSDHLGIKDHVCQICGAAFGIRNKLMKHERQVHKREPFPKGRRPCYLTPKYQNRIEEGITIE